MQPSIEPKHKQMPVNGPPLDDANEFRLMADALPVLMAHVDAQEHYIFSNQAYEHWFGLPADAIQQKRMSDTLDAETYRRFRPHIRSALAGKKESFEAVLSHSHMGLRTFRVSCIPCVNRSGVVEGFYTWMADITEQKRAEEQVRSLQVEMERRIEERTAQLESTNKELEAFCYSVSHDLRAPLRAIRGFGDVLLEQYLSQLDDRGQELLRRTCHATAQMDRLVEDLLKLSRVSRSELRAEQVNLSWIARDIISEIAKAEPARQATFNIEPGLTAHGDERLMRLVLDNLLRNAWKFTSQRREAEIEVGRLPEPEGAFFVRDNGAGFDMQYAGKLFGVFQRLHSTSDFPGSGVGLAIVQRIINRHGGRAWGVGEVDRGATFYFTLPTMEGVRAHEPAPASPESKHYEQKEDPFGGGQCQ